MERSSEKIPELGVRGTGQSGVWDRKLQEEDLSV